MPRVVVPGTGGVALEAGDYTVYAEGRSELGGMVYMTTSLNLRCSMTSTAGEPVALTKPTGSTSYTVGGFSGHSMFALTIPRTGTYQLACEGQGGPATVAFGPGIATTIVVVVVGLLAGLGGAIVTLFVVRRQRRRAREANVIPRAVALPDS